MRPERSAAMPRRHWLESASSSLMAHLLGCLRASLACASGTAVLHCFGGGPALGHVGAESVGDELVVDAFVAEPLGERLAAFGGVVVGVAASVLGAVERGRHTDLELPTSVRPFGAGAALDAVGVAEVPVPFELGLADHRLQ